MVDCHQPIWGGTFCRLSSDPTLVNVSTHWMDSTVETSLETLVHLHLLSLLERMHDCPLFVGSLRTCLNFGALSCRTCQPPFRNLSSLPRPCAALNTLLFVAYCKCRYMRTLYLISFGPNVPCLDICQCVRTAMSMSSRNTGAFAIPVSFELATHKR